MNPATMPAAGGAAIYDEALKRREALMGASGARALVKNFRVFAIAAFACIGGVLYGYNQGMFSGVLAMKNFQEREHQPPLPSTTMIAGENQVLRSRDR